MLPVDAERQDINEGEHKRHGTLPIRTIDVKLPALVRRKSRVGCLLPKERPTGMRARLLRGKDDPLPAEGGDLVVASLRHGYECDTPLMPVFCQGAKGAPGTGIGRRSRYSFTTTSTSGGPATARLALSALPFT